MSALSSSICSLPLQRLNPELLQLLAADMLWRELKWRVRPSVLQAHWWNSVSDRYFQELISYPSLVSPLIKKSTKSFHGDISFLWLQQTFYKIRVWLHWTPSSPKSYILAFLHDLFGTASLSYLRCCLLGCSPHFAPKSLTRNSNVVHFFSQHFVLFLWGLPNLSAYSNDNNKASNNNFLLFSC